MTKVFLSCSYDRDRDLLSALLDSIGQAAGLEVIGPKESIQMGADVRALMRAQIQQCDILVAIMGFERPNVLLETGFALGAGKQVILVSPAVEAIPRDLQFLPFV